MLVALLKLVEDIALHYKHLEDALIQSDLYNFCILHPFVHTQFLTHYTTLPPYHTSEAGP
uniref:Uncharacterized protein n=1 Tax=Anguilla anguilla TaxID=7936 RepID=A0A0E9RUY7_ANGAN